MVSNSSSNRQNKQNEEAEPLPLSLRGTPPLYGVRGAGVQERQEETGTPGAPVLGHTAIASLVLKKTQKRGDELKSHLASLSVLP